MTDQEWTYHTHEPEDHLNPQHGPNLHTHGADGKVDTILGKTANPNPMNARCGLTDCDCEVMINGLLSRLNEIRALAQGGAEAQCPDRHADCPCYEDGLQEGRE